MLQCLNHRMLRLLILSTLLLILASAAPVPGKADAEAAEDEIPVLMTDPTDPTTEIGEDIDDLSFAAMDQAQVEVICKRSVDGDAGVVGE